MAIHIEQNQEQLVIALPVPAFDTKGIITRAIGFLTELVIVLLIPLPIPTVKLLLYNIFS
jgi:hypothetical protein